ncbi:hypothetical protein CEE37_14700 [candidate division LCP-89 bacterium B3_LCP]|uniref:Uncharacterized protein n=1 Tax=candidate division LCP-89 bacterium B3_LCP TaxID=2012998 RepID=A0A532UPK6_UNCL8|nr:MAG: hypothetical protein CEE37_14700 [candidate division LCP-89 bacterium B3_LCP]
MRTKILLLLPALLLALPHPLSAQWTPDPWRGMVSIASDEPREHGAMLLHLDNGNTIITWTWNQNYELPLEGRYQVLTPSGVQLSPRMVFP